MRKMVKSLKCFKYENICVSLGVVYDEIPELLWGQLLWMPIVISETLIGINMPWWLQMPLLSCILVVWSISLRKFLRCLCERKMRNVDAIAVAVFLLLTGAGIVVETFTVLSLLGKENQP